MKKIIYAGAIIVLCMSLTGCAGMTAAGIWASICAGVSAGASVWQASKTPVQNETSDTQSSEQQPPTQTGTSVEDTK